MAADAKGALTDQPLHPDHILVLAGRDEVLEGLILQPYRLIKPVKAPELLAHVANLPAETELKKGETKFDRDVKQVSLDALSRGNFESLPDLALRLGLHVGNILLLCTFEDEEVLKIGACHWENDKWHSKEWGLEEDYLYERGSILILRNRGEHSF
jgi:hypothetical protein